MITPPATTHKTRPATPLRLVPPATDSLQRSSDDLEFSEYGRTPSLTGWALAVFWVVLMLLATAA